MINRQTRRYRRYVQGRRSRMFRFIISKGHKILNVRNLLINAFEFCNDKKKIFGAFGKLSSQKDLPPFCINFDGAAKFSTAFNDACIEGVDAEKLRSKLFNDFSKWSSKISPSSSSSSSSSTDDVWSPWLTRRRSFLSSFESFRVKINELTETFRCFFNVDVDVEPNIETELLFVSSK